MAVAEGWLVLVAVVLVVALIGRIADFRLKHEQERMARKAITEGDEAAAIIRKALQSALR